MRGLDDHISPEELTRLPENLDSLESGGLDQALVRHVQECLACSELAQAHWRLRELQTPTTAAEPSCPSNNEWLELAEGLCPERSDSLLAHAARCGHCAGLLREAMSLMQPYELEEPVPGLKSSTEVWQRRMAVRMASRNAPPDQVSMRAGFLQKLGLRRGWAIASLAGAAAVLVVVLVVPLQGPSDAMLLAQAYNQQRRIPLRIAGGDPVPMASETRGENLQLREPVPLLELKTRAEKHLAETPDNPYWKQKLGEVYLLERKGNAALQAFTSAETSDPHLVDIKADLAAAWYEIDEYPEPGKASTTVDLATAIDLYNQELKSSPLHASILYYNLAQCLEQIGATDEAIENLKKAVSSETSPEWRTVIEAERARLSGKSSLRDSGDDSFVAQSASNGDIVEDRYEDLLDEATGQWLTQWKQNPVIHERVDELARLGLSHKDQWIDDWVAAGHSVTSQEGDRQLASAVQEASTGDEESSLTDSQKALASYLTSGNHPGQIRAQLAETYALQRLGRAEECLSAAKALERETRVQQYSWVRTQLTLEEATCNFLSGNYESARRAYDQAATESMNSGLFWLYLRARAGQAELLSFRGTPLGAWQIDSAALSLCNRIQCPPIRKYALLYDMMNSAEELELKYAALEMIRAGVPIAKASGDETTYAYALETFATLAGRMGDYAASDHAFSETMQVSASEKPIHAVELYRAEWQTDQAGILLRRGAPQAAIALLKQSEPALLASHYHQGRLHFFSNMALARLAIGDFNGARSSALAAIGEVDRALRTLRSIEQKEQWQRESAPEFAQLVKVYLGLNDNQKAFETWEYYRSLAYAKLPRIKEIVPFTLVDTSLKAGNLSDQPVVIVALIDDEYVGWVVAPGALRVLQTVVLGKSEQIHRMAGVFYRLASDPDSSLSDTRKAGDRLNSVLFEPLAFQLGASRRIWLDIDPSLASIPVSALTLPNGRWLGDECAVRVLPPWWSIHPEVFADDSNIPSTSRLVVVNGFAKSDGDYSEAPQIARIFPHAVLVGVGAATQQTLLENLRSADVFHFSGHAISNTVSSYLVASGSEGSEEKIGAESIIGVHFKRCRVAVLAACNTTAANPDRVEPPPDLRNAFLRAGAHGVIASNWDVDDRSTGALMLAFYQRLEAGFTPTQSLQLAELAIRSQTNWQHPYYWASFQFFVN